MLATEVHRWLISDCNGRAWAPLAFSMSAFARWLVVHPAQAFVWLHAHRPLLLCLLACPRDAVGCARVGAYGCRSLAGERAPAGSGRFRRKWAPISPWVLGFCAVFGGGCSLPAPLNWGNAGAGWRFGLIRPTKPPRSRERGSLGLKVARLSACLGPGRFWLQALRLPSRMC